MTRPRRSDLVLLALLVGLFAILPAGDRWGYLYGIIALYLASSIADSLERLR